METDAVTRDPVRWRQTVAFASTVMLTEPTGTDGRGQERSYAVGELLEVLLEHWADLPEQVRQCAAVTASTVARRTVPREPDVSVASATG